MGHVQKTKEFSVISRSIGVSENWSIGFFPSHRGCMNAVLHTVGGLICSTIRAEDNQSQALTII